MNHPHHHFLTLQHRSMSSSPVTAKMSTCVATLFLLLATAAATFSIPELEAIQAAQNQIVEDRNWIQSAVELPNENKRDLNHVAEALRDCDKLYDESGSRLEELLVNVDHTLDDARTWLSGVLANHRTCLDGLDEQGLVGSYAVAQNLTFFLREALAFYGKESNAITSAPPAAPRGPIGEQNQGILTSWSPATSTADFVVAQDGSGTHRTINDALAALAGINRRPQRIIIYVKAGVYNERMEIGSNMGNLMFVGDGMDRSVITGSSNVPDGSSTLNSATVGVSSDGFWARDMTFENKAGPQKHQAVALRVSSDRSIFYRCSFKGYQDTLYVHSLRQFYRDCHIHGTIDFIFGDAAAVFQNCDIFVRRPMDNQDNIIVAQGRDNPTENTGISIQGSRIKPSPEFAEVQGSFRSYLGRPWRTYSRTVIMESDVDSLIDPEGWKEWSGNFALSTLFFAEYKNTGPGASTAHRVTWPGFHVLNNPQEASPLTVSGLIQGESWIPESGVPFDLGV